MLIDGAKGGQATEIETERNGSQEVDEDRFDLLDRVPRLL